MTNLRRWLSHRAEDFMGFLMAVMFAVFILQIITRYLAKFQLAADFGWTMDLSSTCMIWLVFFGGAFVLIEADHVKFDMIYNLFSKQARRWISVFTSLLIVALFAVAMPAVFKYLSWLYNMGKPNSALRNPFTGNLIFISTIYGIYLPFAAWIIWRYLSRAVRLIMGHRYETLDGVALDAAGNPIVYDADGNPIEASQVKASLVEASQVKASLATPEAK